MREMLDTLLRREDLTAAQAAAAMEQVMDGAATPAQIAAFSRRAGDEGRTPRGDRRPRADDAGPCRVVVASPRDLFRHLRHRRRPVEHLQRLVAVGRRARRVRGGGGQAREPFGVEPLRQRGSVRGARCERGRRAGGGRALPRRGRHRVLLRTHFSSVHAARRAGAARARHPHGVQPARSAHQPRRRPAAGGRRPAAGAGGPGGPRAVRARLRTRLGGARRGGAGTRYRPSGIRRSARCATARCRRSTCTPRTSG